MAIMVDPITLSGGLGKKWWQVPDALWRRSSGVREKRLQLTLSRQILPLLQKIEAVQLEKNPSATLFLKGKSVDQVVMDPTSLELALYLYEMALSDGLIRYAPRRGERAISIRGDLDNPVGSCGITPNEVARRYVLVLATPILKNGGHSPSDINVFLSTFLQSRVQSIGRLRFLTKLSKATINEMRSGLSNLDMLLQKDDKWLQVLCNVDATAFLRPLRNILDHEFPDVLNWSEKILESAAKNLDRPEKIHALGNTIVEINDPAMFDALGSWPTATDENGKFICRIDQITASLGRDLFIKLIKGSPALVRDLGSWPQKKIDTYKPYLGVLTGPSMQLLDGLDEGQVIAVLDGLVEKFNMHVVSKALKKKEGLIILQGVVNELKLMNRNSKQTPDKIKKLVLGTYFDDYTGKIAMID